MSKVTVAVRIRPPSKRFVVFRFFAVHMYVLPVTGMTIYRNGPQWVAVRCGSHTLHSTTSLTCRQNRSRIPQVPADRGHAVSVGSWGQSWD